MKKILLIAAISILLAFPKVNFGQTSPNLGTTSGFALFTAVGAFNNTGASVVTGDVGTHVGTFNAFPPGSLLGEIYVADPTSAQAATDVAIAYSNLTQIGTVIGVGLGNGQILLPGVYQTGAASTLNGNLTLDGQGNPDALFIIRIGGAFATGASSNVILTNSASLCNVYWQINGQFDLGDASVFMGTLVADGAITLLEGSSLLGRGLSKAGAISLHNSIVTNPQVAAAGTIVGNATICQGEAGIIYSVPAISNATGYSWNLPSGASITQGSNTNSITVNYSTNASSGNISVQGSNSCGTGALSSNFAVTVNPLPAAPTVGTITQPTCALATGSVVLSGLPAGNWTINPGAVTGSTASTTISGLVAGTYNFTVTNAAVCNSLASANVVITAAPDLPEVIAGDDRSICLNSGTTLGRPAVTGNTYSWSSVPAGFTSTLANPTVFPIVTTTYTVIETTASGCSGVNSVAINVYTAPVAIAGDDRNICLNSNTQIGASSVNGNTYSWSSVPAGFTSTLSNPTVKPLLTTIYTVVETNSASNCQNTNSVTVSLYTAPDIKTQPVDQTACIEESVSFGVTASGEDLTYQWRKGTLALTNGGNISGATSSKLTINHVNVSDAASNYNVLIAGACSAFETSNNVSLTVNTPPIISTAVCVGSSVNFSATSTGAGVTYQWRKGDIDLTDGGNISGSTSATLSINPVNISDASPNYNVIIYGLCSPGGTPLNIGLLVNSSLNIVTEPTNQVACVDNSATFSVGTTGSALTYHWRKGTVPLINGGNISGATSATLTINPVKAADVASDYNVVVTGSCSPIATSKLVSLSLCIPTANNSIGEGDAKYAVTIYPNPFTSSIDVKVNDVSKIKGYELKMYNTLGEVVINTPITKEITTIKTSNLSPGIYLYEVNSNNKTIQTGKLISGK